MKMVLVFFLLLIKINCDCDIRLQYILQVESPQHCYKGCSYFTATYLNHTSKYCSGYELCAKQQGIYTNFGINVTACETGLSDKTITKLEDPYCDIYLETGVVDESNCKNSCYFAKFGQIYSECSSCMSNYNQILEYYPAIQTTVGNKICSYGYGTGKQTTIFSMATICNELEDLNLICKITDKQTQNNNSNIKTNFANKVISSLFLIIFIFMF